MGVFTKLFVLVILPLAILIASIYLKLNKVAPLPVLEEKWWGPGLAHKQETTIIPFKIDVSREVIQDLKRRLKHTLPFQPPLEGVNQHYGTNTKLLATVVDYWKNQYNWTARQELLNEKPHFTTNIQGLKIHFIHAKPQKVPDGVQVLPLMLLHGWPGSVREFYEIIPILTTPQKGRNIVFQVIAPSLPGFGFSEGASKPGLNSAEMGQILNTLMKRLGFEQYYLQGGDWGSIISRDMAILYPSNVLALHRNWCYSENLQHWKTYVGALLPSLFFTEKEIKQLYPLGKAISFLLLESGYYHIQATTPDTVGVALRESPAGLAAYILEKFVTCTNPAYKDILDGNLTKKFSLDSLLDNLMIYWVSRSITTAVRIYAEQNSEPYRSWKLNNRKVLVPSGCNRFENELVYAPELFLREIHTNLIHLTDYDDAGHFAALEVPEILGNDILDFAEKVKALTTPTNEL